MLCDNCGENEVTIHLTDVVNNKKTERRLCEVCYEAAGGAMPFSGTSLDDIIGLGMDIEADAENIGEDVFQALSRSAEPPRDVMCDSCNLSLSEFKKKAAIGCSDDYEAFGEEIETLVLRLHGARSHLGKVPRTVESNRARRHQAAQLRADLDRAIAAEDYETAASLRDRIDNLEQTAERPDVD